MRIPSSIKGAIFAPVLICLFFVLKVFCPESAGNSCFADQFAVPIFLPLVAIYKIFGDSSIIHGQEFLVVMIYWAVIGFLVGLVVDLWKGEETQTSSSAAASEDQKPVIAEVAPQPALVAPLPQTPKPKLPLNLLDRKEEDLPQRAV